MLQADDNNDFERDVWCLLGLPFDAVKMDDVVEKFYFSSIKNKPLFFSTPNLNFLIASQCDNDFRNSVINSDLSVADGKPLVWVARLLNIPIPERVAGSDIVEELIKNKVGNKVLKTFFFGGEEGVAEIACDKLNLHDAGLQCVGNLNPGFGLIEDMSSIEIIDQINQSNADFIIVSLGAKKGQLWIEKNRKNLNAPIISHLGAVVNFIAGTVSRSPKILQKLGLEWLWRIKEEPMLWKRYFYDGISFFNLLIFKVLPLFIIIQFVKNKRKINKPSIATYKKYDVINIELSGYWVNSNIAELNNEFQNITNKYTEAVVVINIKKGAYVDAAVMAKFLILKNMLLKNNRKLRINTDSKLIDKIFRYNCCEHLFLI